MSGSRITANSGYTGIVYDSGNYTSYTGTYSYPEEKYYDIYSFRTTNLIKGSKLGDGIKEILNTSSNGWYNDYFNLFRTSGCVWGGRGYYMSKGDLVGIFASTCNTGHAIASDTTRIIIAK